jgi:hypothetical protein
MDQLFFGGRTFDRVDYGTLTADTVPLLHTINVTRWPSGHPTQSGPNAVAKATSCNMQPMVAGSLTDRRRQG